MEVKSKKTKSIIISSFNVSLYIRLWRSTALLAPLYLYDHCCYITHTYTRPTL